MLFIKKVPKNLKSKVELAFWSYLHPFGNDRNSFHFFYKSFQLWPQRKVDLLLGDELRPLVEVDECQIGIGQLEEIEHRYRYYIKFCCILEVKYVIFTSSPAKNPSPPLFSINIISKLAICSGKVSSTYFCLISF